MKKILILTCSTGEGHNSAARAVETALRNRGVCCEMKDPVSFQSERMKKLIAAAYNNTIKKRPEVFGAVYKLGDLYCASKLPSPVYWANARYSQALKEYILEQNFDAVVCTHLYGMEAMTAIRRRGDFRIPCYGVLTDYVCIPFIEETDLTGFFVPNEEARQTLISKGIPGDRIVISSIPVNNVFRLHPEKMQARRALHIPGDKTVFLIMTGGVGCENMENLCDEMYRSLQDSQMLTILTGHNDTLKNRLDERFADVDKVLTVAFTDRVAEYMAAADVLLSKPGGLSSTEAAVANIPLVHIHAIPGCETYNSQFFEKKGMSLCAENDKQAVLLAQKLASDSEMANTMRRMQRQFVNPDAADLIAEEVMASCLKTS